MDPDGALTLTWDERWKYKQTIFKALNFPFTLKPPSAQSNNNHLLHPPCSGKNIDSAETPPQYHPDIHKTRSLPLGFHSSDPVLHLTKQYRR
jgi:hypothetical protein